MKCLCESIHCDHNEPEVRHVGWEQCGNEAGIDHVEMLGKVCKPCANHYREAGYRVEVEE